MKDVQTDDVNRKRKVVIVIGCFVMAVGLFYYNYGPEKQLSTSTAYFTDDDGATWYADSLDNIPPYTHNGKEAVRINVYSYASGSKTFSGFLTKFPDEVKAAIEARAKQTGAPARSFAYAGEAPTQMLVKQPLKKVPWNSIQTADGIKAMTVTSPDGSELDSVLP